MRSADLLRQQFGVVPVAVGSAARVAAGGVPVVRTRLGELLLAQYGSEPMKVGRVSVALPVPGRRMSAARRDYYLLAIDVLCRRVAG